MNNLATAELADETAVCFFHPDEVPDRCVFSDLEIFKSSDAAQRVELGVNVVYTLSVTNNGPDDARGTVVTDDLGPFVEWVEDDCLAGPPSGTVWTWELPSLPSGSLAACDVTVEVLGPREATVVNQATVDLDNFDPDESDNVSATGQACHDRPKDHRPR